MRQEFFLKSVDLTRNYPKVIHLGRKENCIKTSKELLMTASYLDSNSEPTSLYNSSLLVVVNGISLT